MVDPQALILQRVWKHLLSVNSTDLAVAPPGSEVCPEAVAKQQLEKTLAKEPVIPKIIPWTIFFPLDLFTLGFQVVEATKTHVLSLNNWMV